MYEITVGVEVGTERGKGGAQGLIAGHLFVTGIEIETGEQNGVPGNMWCASIGTTQLVYLLGSSTIAMERLHVMSLLIKTILCIKIHVKFTSHGKHNGMMLHSRPCSHP